MTIGIEFLWIVPVSILLPIGLAIFLISDVLRRDFGTDKMITISGLIYKGAVTFLKRQHTTIAVLAVITAILI